MNNCWFPLQNPQEVQQRQQQMQMQQQRQQQGMQPMAQPQAPAVTYKHWKAAVVPVLLLCKTQHTFAVGTENDMHQASC